MAKIRHRVGIGRGASGSVRASWGLMSLRSEGSVGGMMRDGVKGLDESMGCGDSLKPAMAMRSVASWESSSLRRDPPLRGGANLDWVPSAGSVGVKS